MANEEGERAVSPEMEIWMAGHDAALSRIVTGYQSLLEEIDEFPRSILFEGFRATVEAAISSVRSYCNGWDGIPVPEAKEAVRQILGIVDGAPGAPAEDLFLQDFMDMTPGKILSEKLEWIRAAKERVRALERADEYDVARSIPHSDDCRAELVWIWCGTTSASNDDFYSTCVAAISDFDEECPASLRAWKGVGAASVAHEGCQSGDELFSYPRGSTRRPSERP